MQFSDTSTKLGLVEDIDFLVGTNSSNYSTANKTRNINERFRVVWAMIFEAYGGWLFIDNNISGVTGSGDIPYAEQTITSGTPLYAQPANSLTIDSVSILNSAGGRQKLKPLTPEAFEAMGGDAAFPSSGVPEWYLLQGDVVRLLPTPNYTRSSDGIRIYFKQDISQFAASDTTKTPGFATPFHRMLSIGAALDYAIATGMQKKANNLAQLWNDYERRLKSFYAKRFTEVMQTKRIDPGEDLVSEFS